METRLRSRVFAFVLALLMVIAIMPFQAIAQTVENDASAGENIEIDSPDIGIGDEELVGFPNTTRNVTSSAELEGALADGIDAICIAGDFLIDRTLFVTKNTIIYAESNVTLTRSPEFAGDIFVVGADQTNALCQEPATLYLGGFSGDEAGVLTINGNSESMTVDVLGTVVFIAPNSKADLYEGLVVTNCKKVGNERTLVETYGHTNPNNIGGAVAIVSKDSELNIYGGVYSYNSVNTSGASIYGGAFYNYAITNVYGGIIENNSASRAGAFYNYRTLNIYSAEIRNNTASTSGGAIYLPSSSGARLYLGGNVGSGEGSVIFKNNSATSYGGAIYATGRISAQDTLFEGNTAKTGGAVYGGGNYTSMSYTNCSFVSNEATSYGGAIFSTSHNTLEIDNDLVLLNCSLEKNTSADGGAVYIAKGAYAYVRNTSLVESTATSEGGAFYIINSVVEMDNVKISSGEAALGGGIFVTTDSSIENYIPSSLTANKLEINGCTSSEKGGALYGANSTINLYNSTFKNNTSFAGSAIYLYTGATAGIYGCSFISNACSETNTSNAGAIFVYTGGTEVVVHSTTFVQNSSSGLGGGIFVSGKSSLKLYNITAIENSASKGGFMYETTAGTVVTLSGLTVSSNTATVGGPIIWGNTLNAKLFINKLNHVDLDTEIGADYWSDAIANKLTVTETQDQIPSYTDYSGESVSGLWNAILVKDQSDLESALLSKAPLIKIVSDISLDKTLYILADTIIFTTTSCKISPIEGFEGPLFVVGENEATSLTLGLSTSPSADLLVIEGNVKVSSDSTLNIYENVTLTGTISVLENGTLNLYGGTIKGNSDSAINNNGTVNISGGVITENTAENGGAIYNLGTLTISGGTISANTATLGGAIYSLGTLTITGGTIENNTAENGGAIYVESGAVSLGGTILENNALLGGGVYALAGNVTISYLVEGNTATLGGGAYLDNENVALSIEGSTFKSNTAENGGAIYSINRDFDITNASFVSNSATNGGAIYLESCYATISDCSFLSNSATNGGAIYLKGVEASIDSSEANANEAKENGGFICALDSTTQTSNNTFSKNEAGLGIVYVSGGEYTSVKDSFEYGYASEGGAIYGTLTSVYVDSSTFTGNDADLNGGAIALYLASGYLSGATFNLNSCANEGGAISLVDSQIKAYSCTFNSNESVINGGAISLSGKSNAELYLSQMIGNETGRNGGAVYVDGSNASIKLQDCELSSNMANGNGGAIYLCKKATGYLYEIIASSNKADKGGVAYISDADTSLTINGITASSNTATNGSFVNGSLNAILNLSKENYKDVNNANPTQSYWNSVIYNSVTLNVITDSIPEYTEEGNEPSGKLENATDVSSAEELENALLAGKSVIRIVADFELDRTFYITRKVTIFSTAYHTLTRSPSFGGDIFVVGEAKDGTNSMLKSADDLLILGNPESTTTGLLTFDGNKDNMQTEVYGTVIFVCNGAIAKLYENLSVINCYKSNNEKTYGEQYRMSRPNRVGGAVAIIPFGGLYVYGGVYKNNSVKLEDSSTEEGRNSTIGGVFYSEGNIRIYNGLFEANEGARGGIVYNYGIMKIYGGSFIGNHATVTGGVYYSASYSTSQLYIGYKSSTPVLFKDNYAEVNGGAIYTATLNGVVIYGNTTFESNKAVTGSGGAIYTSSSFTIKNTVFKDNVAKSRGGAIFNTRIVDYTPRFLYLENCSLIGNSAANGGAISLYSSDTEYEFGARANLVGCELVSNSATTGGAICVERESILTVNDSSFVGNTAESEAGAIYIIAESNVSLYNSTLSENSSGSYGGAISVRSAKLTIESSTIDKNYSAKNAGAIYISYSSSIDCNSQVNIYNSTIKENNSNGSGGAIYATKRAIEGDTAQNLGIYDTDFASNTAKNDGGAINLTGGVSARIERSSFVSNKASSTDSLGGAICMYTSSLVADGVIFTRNESRGTGGAIQLNLGAEATLNNIVASRNTARSNGGFLYNTFGALTMYGSTIRNNSSNMGAGVYLYEGATASVYSSDFIGNTTTENGAGMFIYTFGTEVTVNGCSFENNEAQGTGGALYVSGKSIANLYNVIAKSNSATKGGFMYETAASTVVNLAGATVSGNTSLDGGSIIWGNTKNAVLNIDKSKFVDLDTTITDEYWQDAIDNLLTVNEVTLKAPAVPTFKSATSTEKTYTIKEPVSVNDVFNLAINSSDGFINATYDKFPHLDNSSNFMSRGETVFENINGETVTVDTFVYPKYSTAHNMTVGEALMIYQAMLYKKAFPEEEVYVDISSYRFSVQTAVNINRDSRYFGYTRQLVNEQYDEFGFVRVSYLLLSCAKMGIHVNVLSHRDAYPITYSSKIPSTVVEYFNTYMNDPCDPEYQPDKKISDFLDFTYFDWTLSEGKKGGSDMMHTKLCAVSHYLDKDGVVHKNAVWTSSSNLDGIYAGGYNANWKLQTATIVSDHKELYQVSVNYLRLMPTLKGQEEILEFQNYMNEESTRQIDLILAGRGNEIADSEKIVYIGTESDDVFELYFTPFGGDVLSWSEVYNPYSKYMRELYESEDYIVFTWNAAEYSGKFPLGQQLEQMLIDAFHKNKNPKNKIYANMESFDPTTFDDLVLGVDIGFKSINEWPLGAIHNKDLQFSYVKNGQRYYVSLLNSLNLHSGSMYFQSNSALVIKETTCSENSVFSIVAKYSTNGQMVEHDFGKEQRVEPTKDQHGYIYKECKCCGNQVVTKTLHFGSEWITQKPATPAENGIKYKLCTVCDKLIESQETVFSGSSILPDNNTGSGFTESTTIPVSVNKAPLTIEATIQLDPSIFARGGVIVGNYSSMDDENAINLEIYTGGKVRLFYITNGIRTDVVFSKDIRSKDPVHIAVTIDGYTASLYVNGALTESVDVIMPMPSIDRSFMIGGDNREGKQVFMGKIFSVCMFSDVRTNEEILLDKDFVSASAPDVLCVEYFGKSEGISFVSGTTVSGSFFDSNKINSIEKLEKPFKTIEATIMLPTSYADRAGVIIGNYTDGSIDTINLEVLAGGMLRLFYIVNGTRYSYTFTTDIRSDKPINLALTIDGLTASLYINGELAESTTLTMALPEITDGFALGGDYRLNNEQYFKGKIYSLHLFEDVRTEEEIKSDILLVKNGTEGLLYSTYLTENGFTKDFAGQEFDESKIGGTSCDLGKTPLTFEAIIQLDKDYEGRGGIILSNNFKSKPIVSFEVFKEGKLRLYFVNGTTTIDCKFDTDVRSDEPVHIALSVNGKEASLYLNGELVEVKTLALPLPVSTSGYHIGGDFRPGNAQYFKGTIYSVNLFDHARSAEQIAQDMIAIDNEAGLLLSSAYFEEAILDERKFHDTVFEVITEPTKDSEGQGKLICRACGKVFEICSIPYESDGTISNDYTNTDSSLKDGSYYIIKDKLGSTPMTFELLVKLSPDWNDRGGVILGNYDGTSSNKMNLEIYTNGAPRLWYKIAGVSYSYLFNVDIRSNEAVHLTFTIKDLTASLYVNGKLVESIALDKAVPFDNSYFYVGTDKRISTQPFKGEIFSASIFNDVRTPEEIANDMVMITSDASGLLFSEYFVASEAIQAKGPWQDKTAIFVGDSITEGVGCEGKTYWEILGEVLKLKETTGMGVAGSCISNSSGYGNEYDPLINRYEQIPEADLITIFMGTNDYGHDTPLEDFKEALNTIIPALLEKYPSSKLVFITPLHRYGFGTNSQTGVDFTDDTQVNGVGCTLEDYVNAIVEICDIYSVDVINLFEDLDLDPSAEETREYYMPDGLHPNSAGHRYIADYLSHALEELANAQE